VFFDTLRETLRCFTSHGGRVLGAATAFYGALSLAPTLLLAIVATGALTDRADARREVVAYVTLWTGESGADTVDTALDQLARNQGGPLAATLGGLVLVWAAMRLFWQLRYSLHHIWGVREVPSAEPFSRSALRQVRRRLSALAMLGLVVASLVATVLAKAALGVAARHLGASLETRWHVLEFASSFGVLLLLCVAVFKVLPAVRLHWRDAWIGSLATVTLFSVGAAALGWYLGVESTTSAYGAAGSVVALTVWLYYSAQAFFLGAAFTRVWAERHGRGLVLLDGAVRVIEAPTRNDGPSAPR
jgi:membrane protein